MNRTRRQLLLWLAAAPSLPLVTASPPAPWVLHRGNGAEPTSLDPALATIGSEVNILREMFVGLITSDANGRSVFGAATNWLRSADNLTHTFRLDENMTWSDGRPVTAADFVFALQRLFAPETRATYPQHLFVIRNSRRVNRGLARMDDIGAIAVEPHLLRLELEEPDPTLAGKLRLQVAMPVPTHAIQAHGRAWMRPENSVVNGPYRLREWRPQSYVHLAENPRWHRRLPGQPSEVKYYATPDASQETRRFRAHELHIANSVPADEVAWLRKNLPDELRSSPGLNVYYYVFNLRQPPFNLPQVRAALALALDRSLITGKVLRAGEQPAYCLVPPGTSGFTANRRIDEQSIPWNDRLDMARNLLKEAGFGPQRPLEIEVRFSSTGSYGRKTAIAASSMWRQIGVRTKLVTMEARAHFAQLRQGRFGIAWADWAATIDDPLDFLELLHSDAGPANYGGFADAAYDALINESRGSNDAAKRGELMARAEARAMSFNPVIPVFTAANHSLVARQIHGWRNNVVDIHPTRYLSWAG